MKKLLKLLILSAFLTSASNLFAQTVYINKVNTADSKYHLLTCKYLDSIHDSLDMKLAIKKGLGTCPVCNPSAKGASSSGSMGSMDSMSAPKNKDKSGMGQQVNSSAIVAGQQCAVIEKDGKRCIGKAEPRTIYCAMHKNYKKK